jgi:hypothetical protein
MKQRILITSGPRMGGGSVSETLSQQLVLKKGADQEYVLEPYLELATAKFAPALASATP